MTSRDEILALVERNQPHFEPLPYINSIEENGDELVARFSQVLTIIGGKVIPVTSIGDIRYYIQTQINNKKRNITTVPLLEGVLEFISNKNAYPHVLQNADHAVIEAHFGVAENGAVWVTEALLAHRVLPFICQHLIVILQADAVVATMAEAYERISNSSYGFGTFIAGPSKTADIEQSLVLGAHGPRSLTLLLMKN